MEKFLLAWGRGIKLLVLELVLVFVSFVPLRAAEWLLRQIFGQDNSITAPLVTILFLCCWPPLFYLLNTAVGLRLEEWWKEDREEGNAP